MTKPVMLVVDGDGEARGRKAAAGCGGERAAGGGPRLKEGMRPRPWTAG
jgi:hypothetical protein